MSDGLTIVRHGAGDDVLLDVRVVRDALSFRAAVRCAGADIAAQAALLRDFLRDAGAAKAFALSFGVPQYCHCRVDIALRPPGAAAVAVHLQDDYGCTGDTRLEGCTVQLDADPASLDRFAAALAGILSGDEGMAVLEVRH